MLGFGKKKVVEQEEKSSAHTSTTPKHIAALIVAFTKQGEMSEKMEFLQIKKLAEEFGGLISEQEMRLALFAAHLIGQRDLVMTRRITDEIIGTLIGIKGMEKDPEDLMEALMKAVKVKKSKN